ncbi:hypothetical protein DOTSEDRAFT_57684 [Dothistroma septosporum NZE10]|uniref:PCI domain-containing protein n=1 Tax=Dothistroma septosporum (strain NZE10 / CBS 128990) TaxID=675120 RepID=M2WHU1_DOTSN|nr:hypothetical protein DOTSEDRAFT_57684 [Dothistroma septosporum NZE10]
MARRVSTANLPPPTFDLETYASNYEGPLLPLRLAHIATHCPTLSRQALTLAFDHAKNGKDVQLYHRLLDLAINLGFEDLGREDTEWAAKKDEENRRELSRLESELRGYKNNLIRESIRMGQEDLATHHLLTGGPIPDPNNPQSVNSSGYNAAYSQFGKMRDFCTTPIHIAAMTLRLIYTSLLQAVTTSQFGGSGSMHFNNVLINASRLRNSGVKEEEQTKLTPISYVMSGLACMAQGEYATAAKTLLQASFDYHNMGPVFGSDLERTVASANDVAVYGGLCALATMSRDELNDEVLGGPFRAFLEQEPHMRKAITLYTTAKYQSCIETLRRYYSDWTLDVFLGATSASVYGSHVDRLIAKIRERSITAYFSSFSEVSLASLASTFPPNPDTPAAMEAEVLLMIDSGILDARLDVVNGVLIAPRKEARQAAHNDAKQTAEEVERTLLLRLHKVNMTLAGLEVPKAKNQWNSGSLGNGHHF